MTQCKMPKTLGSFVLISRVNAQKGSNASPEKAKSEGERVMPELQSETVVDESPEPAETPTEDTIEVPSEPTQPKEPKKVKTKKPSTKSAKKPKTEKSPAKAKADKPKAKKTPKPSTNGKARAIEEYDPTAVPGGLSNLEVGSTRMRLFKALKKYPKGLSAGEIKEKTGMPANSGHLAVLLKEETERKRIKGRTVDDSGKTAFFLTEKGLSDLRSGAGAVDGRLAGNRIGQKWSAERRAAEKPTKTKKGGRK